MKTNKLLAAAALAVAASGVQAQIVINGSFEDPTQTGWGTYSNLPGWTGGANGIELRNNVEGTAQDGVNFVELDTGANSSMSQTITLPGTGLYELSFWYSARPGIGAGSNGLDFNFGGNTGSVLYTTAGGAVNNWQHYTGVFNLTGGPVTLTFSAAQTSDSLGGSLDNVRVTAVPEPETYAMLLAGLGMMGFIANRRRQRQS